MLITWSFIANVAVRSSRRPHAVPGSPASPYPPTAPSKACWAKTGTTTFYPLACFYPYMRICGFFHLYKTEYLLVDINTQGRECICLLKMYVFQSFSFIHTEVQMHHIFKTITHLPVPALLPKTS